jgi:hypothetical protein
MKRLGNLLSLLGSAVLLVPSSSYACGVCMGQTEGSQIGSAVNGAIFVMLAFIGLMLAGIGAVAFSLWRRAKNPLPAHIEFADMFGAQSTSK